MSTRSAAAPAHSAAARSFLGREHGLLIGDARPESVSRVRFETRNPATGQVIASVAKAGNEDIDQAVRAARAAFEHAAWRGM